MPTRIVPASVARSSNPSDFASIATVFFPRLLRAALTIPSLQPSSKKVEAALAGGRRRICVARSMPRLFSMSGL
jgi:hypothetical protein